MDSGIVLFYLFNLLNSSIYIERRIFSFLAPMPYHSSWALRRKQANHKGASHVAYYAQSARAITT